MRAAQGSSPPFANANTGASALAPRMTASEAIFEEDAGRVVCDDMRLPPAYRVGWLDEE